MVKFVLVYSMAKVIRLMAAGTVLMAAALLVCRLAGSRHWRLKLGMLSLVPLACLTAYSKIFYTGKVVWFTCFMNQIIGQEIAGWYFGIAGILALRYLLLNRRLRFNIRAMRRLDQDAYPAFLLEGRGPDIQVYVSGGNGSGPFAGGIRKPYIVIPEKLIESLSQEELCAVLYHEALHIRLGHVIILNIYAILKILWWIHPLIYLCDRALRENIEYSSDEGSIAFGTLSAYAYGGVMLKTLQLQSQVPFIGAGVTTFAADDYTAIKKRIEKIGTFGCDAGMQLEYQRKKRMLHGLAGAVLLSGAAALLATSYPRYTKLQEISVFDDRLNLVTGDLASDGIHTETEDGNFHISRPEFQKLVSKYGLEGEYVVFSYDTIMKVPGVGGGGQAAMVNLEDPSDVFLLGKYEWRDELKIFIMKYFL